MAAGLSEEEAKSALCTTISDHAVKIRIKPGRNKRTRMIHRNGLFSGDDFQIPVPLAPVDMDFENSRPLNPWFMPRKGHDYIWGYWEIEWMEVSAPDITSVLLSSRAQTLPASAELPRPPRRPKTQPGREAARNVVGEIYPGGVPDQAVLPNTLLCSAVGAAMKQRGLHPVSDDTILRAAGRRK
jgi:hypothetical protein